LQSKTANSALQKSLPSAFLSRGCVNDAASERLSFHPFVKRGIDRVEILAVQMLLRDAEGIGEISLLNKSHFL